MYGLSDWDFDRKSQGLSVNANKLKGSLVRPNVQIGTASVGYYPH